MSNTLVCIDVYTVSAGDTLYTIAEKYDLPVSLLMKVNCITNPYNLQIGTKLCIPGDPSQLPKPEDPPKPKVITHVVEAGDTLYLIAKMHGAKLDDIMQANPSIDPYNLMIGTELYVPLP
ncbi:LysM peptidoglycan-binding domain-containing protein [Anaerovoracaceae bacterium 42-11]|nr:LysM peptidoglycan-binding domain-containing protein [Emergencia sp.]